MSARAAARPRRKQVPFEMLLGTLVRDCEGVRVGRIYDVAVEQRADGPVVTEWHLGYAALGQRLGVRALHLLGIRKRFAPLCVPWRQMDLSDPERPRLRCRKDEL